MINRPNINKEFHVGHLHEFINLIIDPPRLVKNYIINKQFPDQEKNYSHNTIPIFKEKVDLFFDENNPYHPIEKEINSNVFFRDSIFEEDFSFTNLNSDYSVSFNNCTFLKNVSISNCNFNSITFTKCKIERFNFHSNCERLVFFETDIKLFKTEHHIKCKITNLEFTSCRKLGELNIDSGVSNLNYYQSLTDNFILNIKESLSLNIVGTPIITNKLFPLIKDCKVIIFKGDIDLKITIFDIEINHFEIFGKTKKGNEIYLDTIKNFQELKLSNFYSDDGIVMKNISFGNLAEFNVINGSSMGRSKFINVDFSQIKKLEINQSKISETEFSYVKLPINKNQYYSQNKYELYSQIKNIVKKNDDFEMLRTLTSFQMNSLRKGDSSWQNKFILCLNNMSNSHGSDAWKAFKFFVFIGFFFYFLFQKSLNYSVSFDNINAIESLNNISKKIDFNHFFEFLNPIHKVSDVVDESQIPTIDFTSKCIDFFGKILLGYSYFQFISAFRKYSKKD